MENFVSNYEKKLAWQREFKCEYRSTQTNVYRRITNRKTDEETYYLDTGRRGKDRWRIIPESVELAALFEFR